MYKKTSLLLTTLLLGCLFISTPVVAKADVLVTQANNPELKNLIDEGKRRAYDAQFDFPNRRGMWGWF